MKSDSASTIVVIKGLAITAGSSPIFLAISGRVHPTSFAASTVTSSVRHMTAETASPTRSISMNRAKLSTAIVTPHKSATRDSFHMTRNISRNSISSSDIPRMTVTDA